MFEFKNALKNVRRNNKRYILAGIIVFIISFFAVLSLIVNFSANETVEYYLNEYGSEATISINPEEIQQNFQTSESGTAIERTEMPTLTYEDYQQIATSDYVDSVSYEQVVPITSDEVSVVETTDPGRGMSKMVSSEGGETVDMSSSFSLVGNNNLETSSYFEDDQNILLDGDYPTKDNEIVISQTLADQEGISVGDSFKFSDYSDNTQTLKVVGIYQSVSTDVMMSGSDNTIYTTYDTSSLFESNMSSINATYTLNSYKDVESFQQELYDNGLSETFYVNNNQELLDQIIGPVESTMKLLNYLMVIVLIVGGAILVFINLLILRERKFEIGVLRALGMKKSKIMFGLLIEMFFVAIIAMVLALIIGTLFSQPIANALISSSSSSATEQMMGGRPTMVMGGGPMTSTVKGGVSQEETATITTSFNIGVLAIVFVVNMILILLTTIVSSRFITRQQPNEILRGSHE